MIKKYNQFIKENIEPKSLLKSIRADQVLMGDIIDFNSEKYNNIDDLVLDEEFLKKLDKKGFKKNNVEYSRDCETFLGERSDIKFFLIFKKEDSELDPNPEYIVIQSGKNGRWNKINMYKIKENIRNFYDRLSSKTIEIVKNGKNYIYRTSNAGNDWKLQNIQNKDVDFKDIMSDEEIKTELREPGVTKKDID
jgi:hypothetical protein